MPTSKEQWAEFAAWMDWEGGLDGLLNHGIPDEDLPEELKEEWRAIQIAHELIMDMQHRIYTNGGM